MNNYKTLAVAMGFALSSLTIAADTIKIATVGPVTGPVTQYGDLVRTGVNMAVEQINAKGGIDGRKIELITLDDACEPKQAVTAANEVVSKNIQFVVGHVCTGATLPAAEIYSNEGIIMVTPSATSPAVTDSGAETIFRMIGRDDQQAPVAAKHIMEQVKPTKVAVIHDKQSYGQGIATEVKKILEENKVSVAIFEGINKGDSDFSALITKIKKEGVDFVYFGGYHPELGLLLRQAKEQGLAATFMGPEGAGNPDITTIAGDASEGLLITMPADFSLNPNNAELVAAFKAQGKDPSEPFIMNAYASVQLIANGIAGAKSDDPEKVAAYLHANSFNTAIGDASFTKSGDLTSFDFVVYAWHKDASKTLVK